jgi:hypothetical protein
LRLLELSTAGLAAAVLAEVAQEARVILAVAAEAVVMLRLLALAVRAVDLRLGIYFGPLRLLKEQQLLAVLAALPGTPLVLVTMAR